MTRPAPLTLFDPACGTGGFLAQCPLDISKLAPQSDAGIALATATEAITQGDWLLKGAAEDPMDVILTNPPFSGQADPDSSGEISKLKGAKTELLFTSAIADRLRPGGRACVILPSGFAFGSSRQHQALKKRLVEMHRLEAVIGIPGGAFSPYAGLNTVVVIFSKSTGATDFVWMEDVKQIGYTLNSKRKPIEENDLPGAARRFKRRALEAPPDRKGTCFLATVEDVRAENYNLSFSRYQEFQPAEEEYATPEEILRQLMLGQVKINACFDNLAEMMNVPFRTKDFMGAADGGLNSLAESMNLDIRVSDFETQTDP